MRTHACLPVVALLIALVTGATAWAGELPDIGSLVDLPRLRAQVIARAGEAGVRHVECKTGLTPRLVVGIEGVPVPDCNSYVVRVQTSLRRVVTFVTDGDRHVQAEVWRLRPVMKVVPKENVPDAVASAVVTQAGDCAPARPPGSGNQPIRATPRARM